MQQSRAQFMEQRVKPLLNASPKGVYVTFVKKTTKGTRYMLCTLNDSLIPLYATPKGTGSGGPPDIVRVFDLQYNGWRSFSWGSIQHFKEKK
jgi:hypothetical protein